MCVIVCGKFVQDEEVVAGYVGRIRDKFPTKWGVQIAGMIFQTGSRLDKVRIENEKRQSYHTYKS